MSEYHTIEGPARGEPLPAGGVGARVRVPLSGTPSSDWSHLLCAHLTTALRGHAAVGHLRLSRLVQGRELVLDGVEPGEARALGRELRAAVDAANKGTARTERPPAPCNMSRAEAEQIASELDDGAASDGRPARAAPRRWSATLPRGRGFAGVHSVIAF